jgi:outer membrane lipoprotein SlyB
MKNITLLTAFTSAVLLVGCAAPNASTQKYSANTIGQVNRTVSATVVSARLIQIAGTSSTGSSTGAALGAVGGSSIGSNGRDNLAGAIVGAVAGAIAGAAIEGNSTKQNGYEYVVETSNGNMLTIVQGVDPVVFKTGDKVLVLYGTPSRLIEDPRKN